MPRYEVEVLETYSITHYIAVEADDEDAAIGVALEEARDIPFNWNDVIAGDALVGTVTRLEE